MSEPSASLESPWLGLEPFKEEDRKFFFGRNREVEELSAALRHQQLTVLFGRSGNGKTSLLKAGLLPVLREKGLLPVVIRFNFTSAAPRSENYLVAQTMSAISRAITDAGVQPMQPSALAVTSLWEWAHDTMSGLGRQNGPSVVLIFDQFEELFTLGKSFPKQVQAFMEALAALVENMPPADFRRRLESDRSLLDRYDFDVNRCRVLIAIRADFLSEVERYRKLMPSLAKGRYQVELLTGPQALDAVYRPGTLRSGDDPIIPLEIAEQIVRRVACGSWDLKVGDLVSLRSLVEKLVESHRAFDKWLASQLSSRTKAALNAYATSVSPKQSPLDCDLISEINVMLNRSSIYEVQRFSGIGIRSEARALLSIQTKGDDVLRLNRLLIEDAYPDLLRRKLEAQLDIEQLRAVPPLVSLFCSGINAKRLQAKDEAGSRVTAALVQACGDQILPDFYTNAFADVPSAAVVRAMIEDALVTEAGFRQSLPLPDAISTLEKLGIARAEAERALNMLESHRLLSVEAHEGSRRVELIHDLLLDEARKSRQLRKQREAEDIAARQRGRIEKTEGLLHLLLTRLVKKMGDDSEARGALLDAVDGYYTHLDDWEKHSPEALRNQAQLWHIYGEQKAAVRDWFGARTDLLKERGLLEQLERSALAEPAIAANDLALRQAGEMIRSESERSRSLSYDIYVTYSRRDDLPHKSGDLKGWVSATVEALLADHRRFSTEPLRIFFDRVEMSGMDDWRHRCLPALRSSRVLLAFLSPNYFQSEFCRFEWEEFSLRQREWRLAGASVLPILLADSAPSDSNQPDWSEDIGRYQHVDLRPWFHDGVDGLEISECQRRLTQAGHAMWQAIQAARRASTVPGNLRRLNPHFVGRRAELRKLHENLALGAVGGITALYGLGGIGKTELATAYAHGWADSYPAGLWVLAAEGRKELLPLLGELCAELQIPPADGANETGDARGRHVLAELNRRAVGVRDRDPDQGAACLVILDNVSEPTLLADAQLQNIPHEAWLRIVVTTRLGPNAFPTSRQMSFAFVAVDALTEDDATRLIEDHQIETNGHWPATTAGIDATAAREIARELGGFPLALELAGTYLGLHPDVRPGDLLARLRAEGFVAFDAIAADQDVASHIHHREKLLRLIIEPTLRSLSSAERTALNYAALLPPDQIAWPWLRALVTHEHPEALVVRPGYPDPWLALRRRIEGLRLLIPADHPEIARMHRLLVSQIQSTLSESQMAAYWAQLTVVAYTNSEQLSDVLVHDQTILWELAPLREFALEALRTRPEQAFVAELCLRVADALINVGEVAASSELLQGAISMFERRLHTVLQDPQTQRCLLVALSRLADLHAQRGQPGDAEQALMNYQRSLEVSEGLIAANPESFQAARDISVSMTRLADFLASRGQSGDAEKALANYQRSLEVSERLLAANPESTQTARDVSVGMTRLADFLASRGSSGDAERALANYQRSLEVSEHLLAANPESAQSARDVSVSLNKVADFLASRGLPGDTERALGNYQRSLEVGERLLAASPESAQTARDISVSLNKLGSILSRRGQADDAERAMACFHRSLDFAERLYAGNPDSASRARDMAVSLSNQGNVAEAMGQLDHAQAVFERALAITEKLAAADPTNANWARDLSVLLARVGDVAQSKGDLTVARRCFEHSMSIVERLAESDPENIGWQRELWGVLARLGDLEERQGDLVAASRRYERVQTIVERLAVTNPTDFSCQRDYARCLMRRAQLATAEGRLTNSENLHTQAVAVLEGLAHSFPGNTGQLQDLVIAHFEAAKLAGLQQSQDKSISHLGRSSDLLQELEHAGKLPNLYDNSEND